MRMTFGRKKTAPVNAQVDASFDGAACKGVVPEVHTEMMGERANNAGVWLFSAVVFALCFAVVAGAWLALCGRIGAVGIAVALIAARELKKALEEKCADWGITVLSVEVRDILLPKELHDAMSLEAQAEQRRKARIILMEGEQDVADMLDGIGRVYEGNDEALRLRAMHLLYESVRETGGTVVMPSSFSEGFGDVLGDSMKDALKKAHS